MHLTLKPSYRLAALLTVGHAAAGAALLTCDNLPALRLVLACAVAASFVYSVRRTALLNMQGSIVALEWSEDGGLNFQTLDGIWHSGRLLPTTFVTPPLTIINLRAGDGPAARHVLLMADSADAEAYRRLRVRLQWDRTGYA